MIEIPDSHEASRGMGYENQMLVYDKNAGDGAWIQGEPVVPEKFR